MRRGSKHSEETKEKMRQTQLTSQNRPELREEKRQERLGKSNGPHSEAAKEKMSVSMRGVSHSHSAESLSKMRGQKRSLLTRTRISRSLLGHTPNVGSGRTKWYDYERKDGRIVKLQGTYELGVAEYLDETEEEWECVNRSRKHSLLLSTGQRYYPDFYLKRLDLYIDPKGYWSDKEKYTLVEKEYPGRIRFLVGKTYLEQLEELLDGNQ